MGVLALGIIAGVGTAVQIGGQIAQADANNQAAAKKYSLDMQQAQEILAREKINEGILIERAGMMEAQAQAYSGAHGTSNLGLGVKLRMRSELQQTLNLARRDADWKAQMTKAGAEIDRQLASDQMVGTILGSIGTGLTGAYKVGSLFQPSGDAKDSSATGFKGVPTGAGQETTMLNMGGR
jgi:hypothetical protein